MDQDFSSPENLPAVIRTIAEEHKCIESLMCILDEQSEALEQGRAVNFRNTLDVLHYLVNYPGEFHHPREELLFERLRARQGGDAAVIESLIDGHQNIHKHGDDLLTRVRKVSAQKTRQKEKEQILFADIMRFVGRYREHMMLEDSEILPLAIRHLEPGDWIVINIKSREIDDPLFGTRIRKRYKRLASRLLQSLELAQNNLLLDDVFSIKALKDNAATLGGACQEITRSVSRNTGAALADNIQTAEALIRSPKLTGLIRLPFKMSGNCLLRLQTCQLESWQILKKTTEELRTPFDSKTNHLKHMHAGDKMATH